MLKKAQLWFVNQRCLGLPCTILNLARLIVMCRQKLMQRPIALDLRQATVQCSSETGHCSSQTGHCHSLVFTLLPSLVSLPLAFRLQNQHGYDWSSRFVFPVKVFNDQIGFSFCNSEDIFYNITWTAWLTWYNNFERLGSSQPSAAGP